MPHYDYQCNNCHHQLKDVFQSMLEQPKTLCPQCEQPNLRRGPGGGAGLIFQGSGFYVNDYDLTRPSNTEKSSSDACCPCGKENSCSS